MIKIFSIIDLSLTRVSAPNIRKFKTLTVLTDLIALKALLSRDILRTLEIFKDFIVFKTPTNSKKKSDKREITTKEKSKLKD